MSTAELYLTPEEVEEFIAETRCAKAEDNSMHVYGDEGQEYGVSPYITFYINHTKDEFLEIAYEVIELHQELQTFIDLPYQLVYNNKTENWATATPKKLGREMLREEAKRCYRGRPTDRSDGSVFYNNKYFDIEATTEENPMTSASWAISVDTRGGDHYTTVKITFRDSWYRNKNQQVWRQFVEKWIGRLKPEHCYSGYEIGTTTIGIMGAYESDVMERISADYFYGLDVDHPHIMGYHTHYRQDGYIDYSVLGSGIRTPTWCFLLSPFWRNKLGKSVEEVKAALEHPDIRIVEIPYPVSEHNPDGEPALWIQLGELSLYPVDEGLPELPVLANALIKPIRCNLLQLYTLDPWEGDPNPRFDFQNSPQWMKRFDPDSDWPDKERRVAGKPHAEKVKNCRGGERCPTSG